MGVKKQKVFYDSKADVLWLVIKEGPEEEHLEVAPNVSVELDENGELMGVEILHASKVLGVKPRIKEKILEPV